MAWYHHLFVELGIHTLGPTVKWLWNETIKTTVDEKTDKKFKKYVELHIEKQITRLTRAMNIKTYIYVSWSVAGLFLLNFRLPTTIHYTLLVILMLSLIYILFTSYKDLRKLYGFINNFEQYIGQLLKKEIKAQETSLLAKLNLWLCSKNFKDFENLIISHALKYFLRWIKQKKTFVIVRICFYTTVLGFFTNVLKEVFKVSVGF